jgi:S-adenosylmethionine/arginine decarboxylase-like enzyme
MRRISGTHLIIDAYVNDSSKLSEQNMRDSFDTIVSELGMQYIDPLQGALSFSVPLEGSKLNTEDDEGGITVYAPITTSHLSAHAWPLRRAVMLDVFSCKHFDIEVALHCISKLFGFKSYNLHVVERTDPE